MSVVKKYSYILLIGIAAVLFLGVFRWLRASGVTEVVIQEKILNVGTVEFMSDVKGEFTLENVGKHNLEILNVSPDCHCVVAAWDKSPILPGKSGVVKVEYHGNVTGVFQHNFIVDVNTESSPIILTLRGKAVQD